MTTDPGTTLADDPDTFDLHILDANTVRALADLACGDDGPMYRRGWELEELLTRAGWSAVPSVYGARRAWLTDAIQDRRDEPGEVAAFVRRLGHPLEYLDEPTAHQETVARINELLAFEGFRLHIERGHPVVLTIGATLRPVDEGVLRTTIAELVQDAETAELLQRRIDEAARCREAGAYLAAVVMMGSALEGVLFEILRQRHTSGNPPRRAPRLVELIDTCHTQGWIQTDAKRFSQELREYRNLVHTEAEMRLGQFPDADTARICWFVVVAALNDLADSA